MRDGGVDRAHVMPVDRADRATAANQLRVQARAHEVTRPSRARKLARDWGSGNNVVGMDSWQLRNQAREQEKPLRERELRLNDTERREKSDERLRSIDQKMKEPRTPPAMQATPRQPLTQPHAKPAPKRTSAKAKATAETGTDD